MSIAPANKASIAEGPALKLRHSIFTFGPMDFSTHPFAFPIIGCAWVILGNAPTRITICAFSVIDPARRNPNRANDLTFIGPSDSGCRVPPLVKRWLHFSFGDVSDAERARGWRCRLSSCAQGSWQRRRGRRETPGRERGERRRGLSACATHRHLRR